MHFILTDEQKELLKSIHNLKILSSNATLSASEVAFYHDMTNKKKEKLVTQIYFQDKDSKDFYQCKDGRFKSYNPQFIAATREALIEKLYIYYFDHTFEAIYKQWTKHRIKTQIVSGKTIEEDISIWKRFLSCSPLAHMQIAEIKPKHIMNLFQEWTGNGKISRKDFNNRKSVLNGIFRFAVLHEIIPYNPITSLPCNELKFKVSAKKTKAYSLDERKALLDYLNTLKPDAYVLAIQLAFMGIFRIGELKGLSWNPADGNRVSINCQLVEERTINEDLSLGELTRTLKTPKGNPYYSIRTEYVSSEAVALLQQMKDLNPDGKLLFLHEGRELTTDTFNRRLKKYCTAVGIPYLSSHKIRFTGASMLYAAGVPAVEIQPLLGHSNLAMTQHYIGQQVTPQDDSKMARILIK